VDKLIDYVFLLGLALLVACAMPRGLDSWSLASFNGLLAITLIVLGIAGRIVFAVFARLFDAAAQQAKASPAGRAPRAEEIETALGIGERK